MYSYIVYNLLDLTYSLKINKDIQIQVGESLFTSIVQILFMYNLVNLKLI